MSFFKPSPPPKIKPAPTRDTAADAAEAEEAERKKRAASLTGQQSQMLTGSYGVPTELTGSRTLTNG